jgi:dTDP-4-dehydrorhamnose reductase
MKKILLIGGSGQLGFELNRSLPFIGELHVLKKSNFDYLNFNLLASYIKNLQPNFIVNASAYTNVDKAESEMESAFLLNEKLPEELALISKSINASLIHYSTDYVFEGNGKSPYLETDAVNPQCIYGKSKLAGENKIISINPDFIILRTAWLYGHYGKNFYKKMIQLAKEKEILKIVDDQIGCPTTAKMLATTTAFILKDCLGSFKEKKGIYHAVSSGECSWYEFGKIIIENGLPAVQRVVKQILPVSSDQYFTIAKRPAYSVLDNNKLMNTFQIKLPYWKDLLIQHIEDKDWAILDE